ncbi:hypothetical protein COD86_25355 [Bacillus cereus]|nr:hypothetical protein COD14_27365 [Bacillus cereus]PGV90676.1 hypothetical protein COD86_25355 [Bacillus cereus]
MRTEVEKSVIEVLVDYRKRLINENDSKRLESLDIFPVKKVLEHYHAQGKHFVSKEVLYELKLIKDYLNENVSGEGESKNELIDFLSTLLDKYEGKYNYRSYIGTHVLEGLMKDNNIGYPAHLETRISHLLAILCDIIRFECETLLDEEKRFRELLIPQQKRKKRILHSLNSIRIYSSFTTKVRIPDSLEDLLSHWKKESAVDSPLPTELGKLTLDFIYTIQNQIPPNVILALKVSMMPVWTVHDEYVFIRTLQGFEMLFSIVIKGFLNCQDYIRNGSFSDAEIVMKSLAEVFQGNISIIRILMTMDKENFSAFRIYTEGASAIQSEQFKMIELLAAHPKKERLNSPAFQVVPRLTHKYNLNEIVNFEEILKVHFEDEEVKWNEEFKGFLRSMNLFEKSYLLWKNMHYKIAIKMLGSQRGTGDTLGTPYLKMYVEAPLFPFLQSYEGGIN